MYKVIKRDGHTAEFNISRISNAIMKAFDATGIPYTPDVIDLLALQVTADYAGKIRDERIGVETIQDSVEAVLQRAGYADVAKAYILYRKNREKLRNMSSTILDYKGLVDGYLKVSDWRVKENSTVTYSVGGLILSNSGAITANYWLSEIYDDEIGDAHRNADIHIHDLSMLTGYCAGWSLKQLIQEGLGGIPGKITSAPAKHLATLCNQMVNFLGIMQNEGRARRRSPASTRTSPPSSARTSWRSRMSSTVSRASSTASIPPAAGAPRHPSPISRWTGRCPPTWRISPASWAASPWTSPTATANRRWTWSTKPSSR